MNLISLKKTGVLSAVLICAMAIGSFAPHVAAQKCNLNKKAANLPNFSLFTVKSKRTVRKNFCSVKRWYSESKGRQVFKLFKGDNFQRHNKKGRRHARTEAQTNSFKAGSKWYEFEANMKVSNAPNKKEFTIGQVFAGCRGPVMRLAMNSKGRLKVGSIVGGGRKVGKNQNYFNKTFKAKLRSNGHNVQLYIDGKKVYQGKTLPERKTCKNGSKARYHFRWGVYSNDPPSKSFKNTVTNPKIRPRL